jgi:hypothetical protein
MENQAPQAENTHYEIESLNRVDQFIGGIEESIPEISDKPEIKKAYIELVEQFGIRPEYFDDQSRAIALIGVASIWSELSDTDVDRRLMAADMVAILARDHSDKLSDIKKVFDAEDRICDDSTYKRAIDRYTDKELTERLEREIATGLLRDVRERLGVDEDNEDAFHLKVLSVAATTLPAYGLAEPSVDADDVDNIATRAHTIEWNKGLLERGAKFAREIGLDEGLIADAWVTRLDGEQYLCISSGFVEKLLDPELVNGTYDDKVTLAEARAVLEHEYTHTQGGVNIDDGIAGVMLEEVRAEQFAGNKLGYRDIKLFFSDLELVTGFSVNEAMNSYLKGGSGGEIYVQIANNVGVAKMAELIFALPSAYLNSEQANTFFKNINTQLGGLEGILEGVLASEMASGKQGEIEARVARVAEKLQAIVGQPGFSMTLEDVLRSRSSVGTPLVPGLIRDYVHKANSETAP